MSKRKKTTIEEKAMLLSKNYWGLKEIQAYLEIGQEKAIKLKNKTILTYPNSVCPFNEKLILVDTFLSEWLNTNRKNEMATLSALLKNGKD